MVRIAGLRREMAAAADPERAIGVAKFFQIGEGQYGEGDRFLGMPVPLQRKIALRYTNLPLSDIKLLLGSKIHEHRFAALEILVAQYEKADSVGRQTIFDFYLQNTTGINNWDLVDTSAREIVGALC